MYWFTFPLDVFLSLRMPTQFENVSLDGTPIVQSKNPVASNLDKVYFSQWHRDLQMRDEARLQTVLLEIQARLRRIDLAT